jgi:hypothetical protein
VQNLSNLLPGDGDPISALVPTSQRAGETSDNSHARTAPGGDSGVPQQPAPAVSDTPHTRVTVTDGTEPPPATPYNRADGTPWAETDPSDDVIQGGSMPRPRGILRMGEWNQV